MDKKNMHQSDGNLISNQGDILMHQNHQESTPNGTSYAPQPYNTMVSPYSQLYLNTSYGDFRTSNVAPHMNSTPYMQIPSRFDFARSTQPYPASHPPTAYLDHLSMQSYYYPRQIYSYPQQIPMKKDGAIMNQAIPIPCVEVKKENPMLTADTQSLYPMTQFPYKFTGDRMTIEERDMKMQENNNRMNCGRQIDGCETVINLLNQVKSFPYLKRNLSTKGVDVDHFIERVIATQNHKLYNQRARNNDKIAGNELEELRKILRNENSLDISQEMQLKIAYLSAEEMVQYSESLDCDSYHQLKLLKRRLKNRHAARGCRRRKSDEHAELQNRVSILKMLYNALRSITNEYIDQGNSMCQKIKEKDPNASLKFNYKRPVENIEMEKREFHKKYNADAGLDMSSSNGHFLTGSEINTTRECKEPAFSANITPVSRVQPNAMAASVCTSKGNVYEYHSNNARRRLFADESRELERLKARELQLSKNYDTDYSKCEEISFNDGISNGHVMKPSIRKLPSNYVDTNYSTASERMNYDDYENYYTPYPSNLCPKEKNNQLDKNQPFVAADLATCNDMDLQTMMNQMNLENPIAKTVFANMNSTLLNLTPQQSLELSSNNSAQKMESPVMHETRNRMHLSMKNGYNPVLMMPNMAHSGQLPQANSDAFMK